MKANLTALLVGAALCTILLVTSQAAAGATPPDDGTLTRQLQAATKRATAQSYQLQYRFAPDETLRWKVVHLATTETSMQGTTQASKVRTISTKVWRVRDVDEEGNFTFVYSVADVKAWQKLSNRPEVEYDSRQDETPPPVYAPLAKTIGVPLATVTISPSGRVVKRDKDNPLDLGLGTIAIELPEEPIEVGHEWFVPGETRVRLKDGRVQRVKTRQLFTLREVKTGIATITVETQVLTPLDDPRLESQLIQELTKGTIKFDIDAGRLLSRQVDWDETVVGFQGAGSLMKYLARYTEELLPGEATARTSEATVR